MQRLLSGAYLDAPGGPVFHPDWYGDYGVESARVFACDGRDIPRRRSAARAAVSAPHICGEGRV